MQFYPRVGQSGMQINNQESCRVKFDVRLVTGACVDFPVSGRSYAVFLLTPTICVLATVYLTQFHKILNSLGRFV